MTILKNCPLGSVYANTARAKNEMISRCQSVRKKGIEGVGDGATPKCFFSSNADRWNQAILEPPGLGEHALSVRFSISTFCIDDSSQNKETCFYSLKKNEGNFFFLNVLGRISSENGFLTLPLFRKRHLPPFLLSTLTCICGA